MERGTSNRLIPYIVAAAFFMETFDATVIATALPAMAEAFGTTAVALSTGITAYLLALAATIPASGWLADRFGPRTVFCVAIGIFTVASILCGASQTVTEFIGARLMQGAGAALMSPVGRLVVLRSASKAEIVRAIALITWPGLIGPVIGPPVGGFLVTYASWRWIFFLNVPIGLIGMILVVLFVPNERPAALRRFDVAGFLLTASALACLIYGFELIGHADRRLALVSLLIGAGGALAALAVRHMWRTTDPLLDPSSFRVRTFALTTLWAGSLLKMTSGAMPFVLPLYFQIGFGLPAFSAGLLVFAYAAGNLGMKAITTRLLRRFGFRRLLIVNGALVAAFILFVAFTGPGTPRPALLALLVLAGCFRSLQHTSINTLTFADVPGELRSSATTLSTMFQQLSFSVGVAFGAAALSLSAVLGGRAPGDLALGDFRVTFVLLAGLALASAIRFAEVGPEVGADVSGHRPATAREGG